MMRHVPSAMSCRAVGRLFALLLVATTSGAVVAQSAAPVRATEQIVVSANANASEAGRRILRQGGGAIDAAIARRISSTDALRSSCSAISRISNTIFSTSLALTPAGADFTAIVRMPNGSVVNPSEFNSSAMRAYSICCAAVSSMISGISRPCVSTLPRLRCASTCSNKIRS